MKTCTKCNILKHPSHFYSRSPGKLRNECKDCANKAAAARVTKWRQDAKIKLIQHFGSKCVDCNFEGAPFFFDFDHRNPGAKDFHLGSGTTTRNYASMLAEAEKCDLVCARCHRLRTHKQRCSGCQYCI